MNKWVSIGLRVIVAAAGIAYILSSVQWSSRLEIPAGTTMTDGILPEDRVAEIDEERDGVYVTAAGEVSVDAPGIHVVPGLGRLLKRADVSLLLLGFLLTAPMYLAATSRWLLLLRTRGFDVRPMKAFELTMLGNFFNFCLPGITSGDVVKAWYASRGTKRRLDAIGTVVVDRLGGLAGLALLGIGAGLVSWNDPLARRLTLTVGAALAAAALVATIVLAPASRGVLERIGLVRRVRSIRLVAKLDDVMTSWRSEPRALLAALGLSVCVHLSLTGGTAVAAHALGMDVPTTVLLTVLPVLFLAATVPLTWQGLGVMEALAFALLPSVAPNEIVGMLLASRLYRVAYALVGAFYLSRGDLDLHAAGAGEVES